MKKALPLFTVLFLLIIFSACSAQKSALKDDQPQGAATDDKSIDLLVAKLSSPERAQRDGAYKELIKAGTPAVPKLLGLLESDNPDMREYAAAALGEIGDDRAVEPLLKMLKGGNERRYIAAWALGKIKSGRAIGPLIEALSVKNDALQKEATRALIDFGPDAVPALVAALKSPDDDTRKFSARALGIIEDKRAEEPLLKLLSDKSNDVASAAALSLGTAGTEKSIPALIGALKADYIITKVNASIALGQLNAKDAVPPLTEMMGKDNDPYIREWSARALENITGNRYKYKDENGVMVFPYNLYR